MPRRVTVLASVLLTMCLGFAPAPAAEAFGIGVFVPGVTAGSPLYEELVSGVVRVAEEYHHVTYRVFEAGFDQSQWEEKMLAFASQGFDLIVTSNGAMPDVSLSAAEAFPRQKFLILDSIIAGHPQMHTVLYNQVEQAGIMGYLAGLVTTSNMPGATRGVLRVGLIAGQEYAALNHMIRPGFLLGARLVNPSIELDFRIIGNWWDANKAAELAHSMFDTGVDVIMTVCGSANQGVIQAAQDRGKYVLYIDADRYSLAPGTILGCASLAQEQAVYAFVRAAVSGQLAWGEATLLSVRDGYVDLVDENPLYVAGLPESLRARLAVFVNDLRSHDASWLKVRMEVPVYW